MLGSSLELPTGYIMERDADVFVLRRLDGSMVGAFSARGAVPEAVRRVIGEADRPEAPAARREEAAPGQPSLRARFFGHFELLCGDEAVALGRNGKALTILKYLLAQRTRPVSQDHLMGWLWPDSSLKKARWSLNSAVHGLRKLLGDCPSLASVNCVLLEEGHYRLCPAVRVTTDVDEFDGRYERGRSLERSRRMPEAVAEYERAIGLYRGDYLVEDLYEDWTMVERERLANAYVDMLGRLAVHYVETGQPHECIRACYRILEKDRCHEDSYRLLMRCYVLLGLRGRALRQYRLCEKTIGREYGMSPSPETRALYRSLLSHDSARTRPVRAPKGGRE
ncbi:MAG TPA: BTAD domain-containing putative transcriptional regulator [Rubrobacter sp.]|nr:BTAD domain-containing putative transcriptional regulator [Rubrobacter sp.]